MSISEDEVHVWLAAVDDEPPSCGIFEILSADERDRETQLLFVRDRGRFAARRAILRMLLSRYLEVEPTLLEFEYGDHGKPAVRQSGQGKIRFSLSHSRGTAMYAISYGREIGVDVEYLRPVHDIDGIVKRLFGPREREIYAALADNEKERAFFKIWTLKEALLKAIGTGWSQETPESFEVPDALISGGDEAVMGSWSLRTLRLGESCAAAIAVEGRGYRLQCREWAHSD